MPSSLLFGADFNLHSDSFTKTRIQNNSKSNALQARNYCFLCRFFSLHFGVVYLSFFICKLSANKSSRNAILYTALFKRGRECVYEREAETGSIRDGKSLCLPLFFCLVMPLHFCWSSLATYFVRTNFDFAVSTTLVKVSHSLFLSPLLPVAHSLGNFATTRSGGSGSTAHVTVCTRHGDTNKFN